MLVSWSGGTKPNGLSMNSSRPMVERGGAVIAAPIGGHLHRSANSGHPNPSRCALQIRFRYDLRKPLCLGGLKISESLTKRTLYTRDQPVELQQLRPVSLTRGWPPLYILS